MADRPSLAALTPGDFTSPDGTRILKITPEAINALPIIRAILIAVALAKTTTSYKRIDVASNGVMHYRHSRPVLDAIWHDCVTVRQEPDLSCLVGYAEAGDEPVLSESQKGELVDDRQRAYDYWAAKLRQKP